MNCFVSDARRDCSGEQRSSERMHDRSRDNRPAVLRNRGKGLATRETSNYMANFGMDSEDDESIVNFRGIPDSDNDQNLSIPHHDESSRANWMQRAAVELAEFPPRPTNEASGSQSTPVGVMEVREYSADNTASVYDDFHTIDWVQERNKDKTRHKIIYHRSGWRARVDKWFDAASGWLIVLLVGLLAGIMAGVIDISAEWMTDLKNGICRVDGGPFYDRLTCCWLSNETEFDIHYCTLWSTWSDVFHVGQASNYSGHANNFYEFSLFDYFSYVLISVILASVAGLFVVVCAPYAAGSGIPEVGQPVVCVA